LAPAGGIIICNTWAIRAPEFAFACSRTIQAMLFREEDPPMPSDSPRVSRVETVRYDDVGPHPVWSERIATIVAASLAVLIVAIIAVLMGTA
jgi:hypothetical protein